MTDKLVPNIITVRSQLSSDNSNQLLTAIGSFVDNMKNATSSECNLGRIFCLRATSLSFDDIPEETCGMDELSWVIADLILKRFDYDQYRVVYQSLYEKDHLDGMFIAYFSTVLGQFYQLTTNAGFNIKQINDYFDVLVRKKATSIRKNKWGDVDTSDWSSVLDEFAYDKFMATGFMRLTDELPGYIKTHAKSCEMDNLYGRFVEAVLNEEINQRGDQQNSLITGEDFENHIKELIETNIPEVQVETTPRTGDDGADLIVFSSDYSVAIQAKYYTSSVGNSAVQEIYSAKSIYQTNFAVVVTNSRYTKAAQEAAETLNVILATEDNIVEVIKYLIE